MKTINLTITHHDHESIQQLAKLGVLRVEGWMQTDERMQIQLHERTWGEWIGELFDPGKAEEARGAAADAIARALDVAEGDPQLTLNIRDRCAKNKEITGTMLARDFALIGERRIPRPGNEAAVAADNNASLHPDQVDPRTSVAATASSSEGSVQSGPDIQLTNRRLAEIDAKAKVTWTMTTDREIAKRMSANSAEALAGSRRGSRGAGEISGWMSLPIATPEGKGEAYRALKNEQMAWAYRQVLAESTTTVAIAPIEDIPMDEQIIREQVAENQWIRRGIICCSDDSVRLLLEAIVEAKAQKPDLKVIIACAEYPDRETLALRVDGCMEQLGLSND